jgi:hypothetical protein
MSNAEPNHEEKQIPGGRLLLTLSRSSLPVPQAPIPTHPILGQQDGQQLGLSRLSQPHKA